MKIQRQKNRSRNSVVSVRHATDEDILGMLKIERSRYSELYDNDNEALAKVEERFRRRIRVAQTWMWVALINEEVVGFITGQPTNSEPADFVSWEESTDNGTLQKTFVEDGMNVYVVNLDVSRTATKMNAQYMLMAQLGAKAIRLGKDKVIFESRMPGFREYTMQEIGLSLDDWKKLSPEEKMKRASAYSKLTIDMDGKKVLKDRLLKFYDSGGFKLEKVFANAFKDPESLDFGMLCTGANPIPKWLRFSPVNIVVSKVFEKIGEKPELLNRMVG